MSASAALQNQWSLRQTAEADFKGSPFIVR
jgi:hypothetical protein